MDEILGFLNNYIYTNDVLSNNFTIRTLLDAFENDQRQYLGLKSYVDSLNDDTLADTVEELEKYIAKELINPEEQLKRKDKYIYHSDHHHHHFNKTPINKLDEIKNNNSINENDLSIDWNNASFDVNSCKIDKNKKNNNSNNNNNYNSNKKMNKESRREKEVGYISYDDNDEIIPYIDNDEDSDDTSYVKDNNDYNDSVDQIIHFIEDSDSSSDDDIIHFIASDDEDDPLQNEEYLRIINEENENARAINEFYEENATTECIICTNDYDKYNMYKLENCDHSFCYDCIRNHIKAKVDIGQYNIKCPDPECKKEIHQVEVQVLFGDEIANKFASFNLNQLITSSEEFFERCPNENCNYVAYNDEDIAEFDCPMCKKHFCLKCKIPYHTGSTCEKYQEWKKDNTNGDDKLNRLVKEKNFKICINPKCKAIVEKAQGCNHMTCRCGTQFLKPINQLKIKSVYKFYL
ncbi:hypothetical protein PPL_02138 [Heterostelium album PN500]|uniref:RBR-type E3 ubiquitin transferase n=1 Tax=Heterostelium pallidum (strain ATCC 26659 / Pp 5 / PN500) TaxID=670386 RepID=D3B1G5_HETP5|nr:hypothetical protein PPL_02138 [Heterostelium album PN500]EFA85139.1 hypothetical protein PPL_02138 [Heterostelium album PN500]|eukprot:XP_020437248.1 hypothetical protein PPL_02138 [Heterostelium album PN500]